MTTLLLVPSRFEFDRLPTGDLPPDVVVARCGVGLVEAALRTARLLDELEPDDCVLAGLGGTRDPDRAPLGALVGATAVRNEGVGAGSGAAFLGLSALGIPGERTAPDLVELDEPPGEDGRRGVVGTVAAASADATEAAARARRHPDVLVEEMEGWAVALACADADVPCSIVRAVCNIAGDRERSGWAIGPACEALSTWLGAWTDA